MRIKVHYVSQKGCAKSIADVIAGTCQCTKEALLPAYMPENIDLMFLGCEGGKADKVTMDFINVMNRERVRNAALFCCGAGPEAVSQMRKALVARGVNVLDRSFTAPLKGLFGGGPKPGDLSAAAEFAQNCMDDVSKK